MLPMLRAALSRLRRNVAVSGGARKVIVEPVLTVVLLLLLYAGWNIVQDRSIERGLRAAFFDSYAIRAERRREHEATLLQAEIRRFADANRRIQGLLRELLRQAPTAARAQVDAIHNGVLAGGVTALLRFDVINEVIAQDRGDGDRLINQPLSDWDDVLPSLLIGDCQFEHVSQLHVDASRIRLQGDGIAAFLTCPMIDRRGTLLGDVRLSWDNAGAPPGDTARARLIAEARAIAGRIAAVFDGRDLVSPAEAAGDPGRRPPPGAE